MMGSDNMPRLIDFGETTEATLARIRNDNDRLEALFRGSVLDINEMRRSRIAEMRRQRDEELENALLGKNETSEVPQVKRLRMPLFDD